MALPGNTTVCIRITDRATDAGGNVIYENRAVLFGKIRWGKITFYEVYEDTEKVAALDAYLAGPVVRRNGLNEAPRLREGGGYGA